MSGIFRGQTVYSDYSCGGTLINRFKVLTAGHCVITEIPIEVCYDFFCYDLNIDVKNPFDSTQYTVYLGAYDIKNLNQQPAVQMSVKKVIRVIILKKISVKLIKFLILLKKNYPF